MTVRVNLPDGSSVDVNTDDTKAAAAAARKYWAANGGKQSKLPKPPPKPKADQKPDNSLWGKYKRFTETAADFAGNAVDQVLPNWMDELYAAPRAVGALFRGEDAGKAFTDAQRRYKANQRQFAAKHPTAKTASTATGVVSSLALPAGRLIEGASLGQKALQAAKVGALYGAASGAGEGEGLDPSRRASNSVNNAVPSAITGAMFPFAARGSGNLGKFAREYVPGVDNVVRKTAAIGSAGVGKLSGMLPPSLRRRQPSRAEQPSAVAERAWKGALEAMGEGHLDAGPGIPGVAASPAAIAAEVARRNERGVPAMVGDVSPAMRSLTASASRGMGPGQTMVREALEARKAAEGARVANYVRDNLPTVPDPVAFVDGFRRQSKAAVSPMYAEAYSQPVYRSPAIQAIEKTPAFQEALPQAFRNVRNQIDDVTGQPKDPFAMGFRAIAGDPNGLPPNTPYFQLPDGQLVTVGEGLTAEGYDQVIRAMHDTGISAAGRNPVTGRIENNTNSVHINSLAGQLRDQLAGQNAPYARAVRTYGDDMVYTDAFRQGQDIGKLSGPEISAQTRSLPEFAMEPWATGAGTAIADEASKYAARHPYGDVAGRVSGLLGDDAKQAALSATLGGSGGVGNLQDLLEAERQATANWRGISKQGSASQAGQAEGGVPLTLGGIKQTVLGALSDAAGLATRKEYARNMADIVTSRDPQAVDDIARKVRELAQARQDRSDRLHGRWLVGSGLYGRNLPATDPVPDDVEGWRY
jgi:hypothetical protein